MLDGLRECYRILDVEPGASLEEVRRSYRELVKVWHPDRFANDPSLQAKAQEKLKQINLAYERVCEDVASASRFRPTSAEPPKSEAKETAGPSGSSNSSDFRDEPRPKATNPSQPPQPAAAHQLSGFFRLAGIFIIVGLVRAIWHANHNQSQQPAYAPAAYSEPSPVNQPAQPPVVQPQSESKTRQRLNIEQIALLHQQALKMQPELAKLGMTIRDFSIYFQTNQSKYDLSEGITFTGSVVGTVGPPVADSEHVESLASKPAVAADSQKAAGVVELALAKPLQPTLPSASSSARNYFTVGSSKSEVVAIQGSPTRFSDTELFYGTSSVQFEQDRVRSWDDRYPCLKAKLLPSNPIDAKDFFTVGSTKDEVLTVQGTPSRFNESEFFYGTSSVRFQNGSVRSWDDRYPKLKVKLLPTTQVKADGFFTVGSTKDEVLAVQGTPTRFTDDEFTYGTSAVYFRAGLVRSWDVRYPTLKAELLPSRPVDKRDFFTVGSSKDEVLAVQGTPSRFSDSEFVYGTSSVLFRDGMVRSWDDRYPKLKAKFTARPPE